MLLALLSNRSANKLEYIIQNVDGRKQPIYLTATMTLLYINGNGDLLDKRKLKYWRHWRGFNAESVMIRFINPEDVRNTTFLSITEQKKNKQLIFLPALGRTHHVKKVNQMSYFMNSDFFYSDLRTWELAKNHNRLIYENNDHYFIESVFKNLFVNQRLILKVSKETYFISEVEYFKQGCDLPSRKMIASQIKQESGILMATHIRMVSFKKCSRDIKSSSEIILEKWDTSTSIDKVVFSETFMQSIDNL